MSMDEVRAILDDFELRIRAVMERGLERLARRPKQKQIYMDEESCKRSIRSHRAACVNRVQR